MTEWTHVLDDTKTYIECPKGEIQHNYEWEKRVEEDDDPGEDVFAFKQICSMTPGKNEYSDCSKDTWHNEWMKAENKLDTSEFNNVSLYDSDPDGGSDTIGVTIGYAAASLNWSFNTGGEVDKSLDGERPIWEVNEIWASERTETQELEPGSVMIMDDDVEEKRKLTTLRFEGHFERDDTYDNYYLYWYWDLYFDNYKND